MISVIITRDKNSYRGVSISGHAGYADSGQDIVCAAVSVLVLNTFNSIEMFTQDEFESQVQEDGGYITMNFPGVVSDNTKLLLDSMSLGLDEIQKQYGDEYISLQYKEV